jgi:ABC-type multidrug transport system fused ATPase/permease subunit
MTVLSFVNDFVLAAGGDSLATGIRNFIGPLLMLTMGIVSMTFLFRREMTQFMIFLIIAIVVAIIFYAPDIIKNLAQSVNTQSGNGGTWGG